MTVGGGFPAERVAPKGQDMTAQGNALGRPKRPRDGKPCKGDIVARRARIAPFQGCGWWAVRGFPGRCPGLSYRALSGLWLVGRPGLLSRPFRAGVGGPSGASQGVALGCPIAPFQGNAARRPLAVLGTPQRAFPTERIGKLFFARSEIGQRHFHFFPTGPVPVEKWFGYYRCPPCSPVFRPVLSAAQGGGWPTTPASDLRSRLGVALRRLGARRRRRRASRNRARR